MNEAQAKAIQKQWESQREELLTRIMVLELENQNLRRIVDQQDMEIANLKRRTTK